MTIISVAPPAPPTSSEIIPIGPPIPTNIIFVPPPTTNTVSAASTLILTTINPAPKNSTCVSHEIVEVRRFSFANDMKRFYFSNLRSITNLSQGMYIRTKV